MKKKFLVIIIVILFLFIGLYIKIIKNKSTDINFAVEHHLTKNIFGDYKLRKINKITVIFSDGTLAVLKINGLEKKAPYKSIELKVFLEKSSDGSWKVKKIYPSGS